jgi:hypothetical protein
MNLVARILADLRHEYIRFPRVDELPAVAATFERMAGFPNVVGAADGTHVQIIEPSEEAVGSLDRRLFWCRHGHYAVVLHAVVGPDTRFVHIVAGICGSAHDSSVFEHSMLGLNLEHYVPHPYHLLADSAYTLREPVLTMYRQLDKLDAAAKAYVYRHVRTRQVVERAFGVLKQRFRALLGCVDMQLTHIQDFLTAACVIHNICVAEKDPVMSGFSWEPVSTDRSDDPAPRSWETPGANKRKAYAEAFLLADNGEEEECRQIIANYGQQVDSDDDESE